jgi:integrase
VELSDYVREIYQIERVLRPESFRQLLMSVQSLERWAGGVTLRSLSSDLLNKWIIDMESRWASKTLKRRRDDVMGVWRHAFETGRIEEGPRRVRRVQEVKYLPEAWTMEEIRLLVAAAKGMTWFYPNGIHAGRYWEAFIRFTYDTGLRLADVQRMRSDAIRTDGTFRVVQGKTQREIVRRIRQSTHEAIKGTYPPERELIFAWCYSREQFWYHWRKVLRAAGQPIGRRNGPQKLRRASASHLERIRPGAAARHLGHRTPGLAEAHYIDPLIAGGEIPLPPAI